MNVHTHRVVMTSRIFSQIDNLVSAISSYKGNGVLLDQKIDFLTNGYNVTRQRLQNGDYDFNKYFATLNRLKELIEIYVNYMNQSDLIAKLEFLQNVSDDLVSSFPRTVRPMVLLGEYDHLFNIPSGGFPDFFIESQYLSSKSLSSCFPIAHEVGHILFLQYALDSTNLDGIASRIGAPIWKKSRKLKIPLDPKTLQLWAHAWLGELVADAVAASRMGPQSVLRDHFRAKLLGQPLHLGSDSHPPEGLRMKLMRDRILRDAKTSGYKRKSIRDLKKLKLPSKYEMMTKEWFQKAMKDKKYNKDRVKAVMKSARPSEIASKLAFDKEIISTAISLVNDILSWGSIETNMAELESACQDLEKGLNPNCMYYTKLAALLEITQGFPNTRLERIIIQ